MATQRQDAALRATATYRWIRATEQSPAAHREQHDADGIVALHGDSAKECDADPDLWNKVVALREGELASGDREGPEVFDDDDDDGVLTPFEDDSGRGARHAGGLSSRLAGAWASATFAICVGVWLLMALRVIGPAASDPARAAAPASQPAAIETAAIDTSAIETAALGAPAPLTTPAPLAAQPLDRTTAPAPPAVATAPGAPIVAPPTLAPPPRPSPLAQPVAAGAPAEATGPCADWPERRRGQDVAAEAERYCVCSGGADLLCPVRLVSGWRYAMEPLAALGGQARAEATRRAAACDARHGADMPARIACYEAIF